MELQVCKCGRVPTLRRSVRTGDGMTYSAAVVCQCGKHTAEVTGSFATREKITQTVVDAWNSRWEMEGMDDGT